MLKIKNNIEVIYEDDNMNCNIVRRKDNNKVFKLCYDDDERLREVYKLDNDVYIDSDESELF